MLILCATFGRKMWVYLLGQILSPPNNNQKSYPFLALPNRRSKNYVAPVKIAHESPPPPIAIHPLLLRRWISGQ